MGLLTDTKTCPDGHGLMQRQPGFWALQGVRRYGGTLLTPGEFMSTTQAMVLKVWECPHCHLVRLYADDQEP